MKNKYKKIAKEILGLAGLQIDGSDLWDIKV
jgi:hypothetical protein